MKIEKYNCEEKIEMENFLKSFDLEEAPLYLLDQKTVVVIKDDSKIFGIAGYRTNRLHSKVLTIDIVVHPDHRRKGIGRKLHEELLNSFKLPGNIIGYDGCCDSKKIEIQLFLLKLGYEKYLDCHCIIIDLEKEFRASSSADVLTLKKLYLNENYKKKVREFYISRYVEEHIWSPTESINHDVWNDYYDEGNSEELGVVLIKDNTVVGSSFAYESFGKEIEEEDDQLLGIGPVYADKKISESELSLVKKLLSHQAYLARKQGHLEAYLEIDSSESVAAELLEWLPIKRSSIFERYRLSK